MSPQPHHDALALVESAYDLDGSDDVHMRRLLAAAAPSLDHGLGLVGVRFRVVKERAELLSRPTVWGNVPPAYECVFAEALDQLTAHDVRSSWGHPVALDTQSDALERAFPDGVPTDMPWLEASVTGGVSDNLVAKMVDVTGLGCLVCAPLGTARSVDARDEARWRRLMTHVVAGWRLRRELGEAAGEEAVLEPDGRVVHASGPARSATARSALREAAVAVDRARTRSGRQDVEAALDAWRGLVSGRWSLVDRFDTDGRRFLIARRNDPPVIPNIELSLRERQVAAYVALGHANKHIAYAMGLAESTISSHLRAAMRKLGVGTVPELAQVFVAVEPPELE